LVFQEKLKDLSEIKVKTTSFSSGIYTIQVKSPKFNSYKRFVKS
jgi:hypothetical protein